MNLTFRTCSMFRVINMAVGRMLGAAGIKLFPGKSFQSSRAVAKNRDLKERSD